MSCAVVGSKKKPEAYAVDYLNVFQGKEIYEYLSDADFRILKLLPGFGTVLGEVQCKHVFSESAPVRGTP